MKENNLVIYKSNKIVEASYKLSLNEQRIVLACIGQVNSNKELLVTDLFELTAKDFSSFFSVSDKAAYQALTEVTESLFNRYVFIENPYTTHPKAKYLKTRWISSIAYYPDEGKISLRFAQDMLPYLSDLKKAFTRYKLEHIGKMTSIYAIRLYELLAQWQSVGKREVALDWLKQQFDIADQYQKMCNFKDRVLEPAIKDVNDHSNFKVSWEQRKTGRRVTHLIFTFSEKTINNKKLSSKSYESASDELSPLVEKLLTFLPPAYQKMKSVLSLLIKFQQIQSFDYVKRNILYTNKKSSGSYRGFLSKSLHHDWGHDWQLEQETPKVKPLEPWQRAGFDSEKEYDQYQYKQMIQRYTKKS